MSALGPNMREATPEEFREDYRQREAKANWAFQNGYMTTKQFEEHIEELAHFRGYPRLREPSMRARALAHQARRIRTYRVNRPKLGHERNHRV